MIAALKPFVIAIVKNDEVTNSRFGSPNETFEMPRLVNPPILWISFTVSRVAIAAFESELTAIAKGSMMMSFFEMPYFSASL